MPNLFNQDFQDFLQAMNENKVEYLLVGGYAVILHGYIRSTGDMDVWVKKSRDNYTKLKSAFLQFGASIFTEEDFLGNQFDVWGFGREPNRIEIMSEVKGIEFDKAYQSSQTYQQENIEVRYIHFNHLIEAKEAAGRYKDKNDIEQLQKKKPK